MDPEQQGAALFAELVRAAGEDDIEKDLYYDESTGWDLEGLRSDLAVYSPAAAQAAVATNGAGATHAASPGFAPPAAQPPHSGARAPSARPHMALPVALPRSSSSCSIATSPRPPAMMAADAAPSSSREPQRMAAPAAGVV